MGLPVMFLLTGCRTINRTNTLEMDRLTAHNTARGLIRNGNAIGNAIGNVFFNLLCFSMLISNAIPLGHL